MVERLIISIVVIAISTGLQLLLKLVSASNGGSPPLEKEDLVLWSDWTNAAVISFAIFAVGNVDTQTFTPLQLLALLGVIVLSCAVIPTYVRFHAYDASQKPHWIRGILIPNSLAAVGVGVAIVFGVNFAG